MSAVASRSSPGSAESYGVYRTLIYHQALRVLHDPADSEDATQEVLLRIFRFLPRFQNRSTFSTWVHRITYNVCMNVVADRKRNVLDFQSERDPENHLSPEALVEHGETRALVQQAIADLPPKYRRPLCLYYICDLSYEEIARRTGLRLNTVKIRIHRAKKLLRASLEQRMPGPVPPGDPVRPTSMGVTLQ